MEATLRTAAAFLGGSPNQIEFTVVRAVEGLREADVVFGGRTLHVGVADGLVNAKTLLDKVVNRERQFHIIEVMACPGGCVGGGGQPYPPRGFHILDPRLLRLRARALYTIDGAKKLRRSHENPVIMALYDEFLGTPGGEKTHELLHTRYAPKLPRGIR
jgi:iron only hydrogenase large subunit-like protein